MKIKQLIWIDGHAETPFGDYVLWTVRQEPPLFHLQFREFFWLYKTESDARAAAQADFERRARRCFEDVQQKGKQDG